MGDVKGSSIDTSGSKPLPSLFRRLSIGITLAIAVVALCVVLIVYLKAVREEVAALQEKADTYLAYLLGTLEIPLWNMDAHAIRVIGKSFSQNELVDSLTISSILAPDTSQVVFSIQKTSDQDIVQRSGEVMHGDKVIGAIRFALSKREYKEDSRKLLYSFAISTLVILAALLLITHFFLRLIFQKPLDRLNAVVDSYASGNYAPPERDAPYAEFASLEEVLAEMGGKINSQLQKLQEAEAKYRSIFENAYEGIFQSTADGRFTRINPAGARILGYETPDQVTTEITSIGEQLYVRQADRRDFFNTLRRHGHIQKFETQLFHRSGTTVWVEIGARGVKDDAGTIQFVDGYIVDISHQKKAEKERLRLQDQLQQSQKLEALGSLAGGIAHDFNNLLQVMSGYLQLLLMKKDESDPDYKYLIEVERATARASDLIKRLLTFSRKMEIHVHPLSLNEVVEATVNLLERTIPKMVTIRLDLAADLPLVLADRNQMEQVLMNLVSNAVDAMSGSGTLSVTTARAERDSDFTEKYPEMASGRYILLRIEDTGQGMNETTRRRAFEPFFTTKAVGKGTGLGLSTVYGIIKEHNGLVHCSSQPGKGTAISIYLPVHTGEMKERPSTGWSMGSIEGGNETILLVDDEQLLRDITEEILKQYGYTVLTASSGEEALETYRRHAETIDLVTLDLGMPGMGGETCLRRLKQLDRHARIVVASGYAAHPISRDPLKYGAAGFISKPYTLDILLLTVRRILDDH